MLLRTAKIQTSAKKTNLILKNIRDKTVQQIKFILANSPKKIAKILYKYFINWEKEFKISRLEHSYINMCKPIKRLQPICKGRRGIKSKPFSKIYFQLKHE